MLSVQKYLETHFITIKELSQLTKLSEFKLLELQEEMLIPKHSYEVNSSGALCSSVFGELDAESAKPGLYYAPSVTSWIKRTLLFSLNYGNKGLADLLKKEFFFRYKNALIELKAFDAGFTDIFPGEDQINQEAFEQLAHSTWQHHMQGTYGVCVINQNSEVRIVQKQIAIKRLTDLTEDGKRVAYSPVQANQVREAIDAYNQITMPFSPADYPLSSRKRLVDNVQLRLAA